MNVDLLAVIAYQLVNVSDIATVGRGAEPKQLWVRTTVPGQLGPDAEWSSDGRGVHIHRSPAGTGLVRWEHLHRLMKVGATPELVDEAVALQRRWSGLFRWNPRASREEMRAETRAVEPERSLVLQLIRELEQRVVSRGLEVLRAEVGGQLALFGPGDED